MPSVAVFICVLVFVSTVWATNIQVTVDSQNANEYWVQLIASPQGIISSIDINVQGTSYNVPNVDWDHGKGQFFVRKIDAYPGIPMGSSVFATANLKNGKKVNFQFSYNKGSSISFSDGSSSAPQPQQPTQPQQPSKPQSPAVIQFEKQIEGFRRNSGSPAAYITSEDSLRKGNKDALRRAMERVGVQSLKARAFLFSTFGLESETMYDSNGNAQRDASKDFDPLYKNFSPLNMNGDMLNHIGYKGDRNSLNRIGNIQEVVEVAIKAINKLGLEGFLNFHRGGASGWKYPKQNEQKYKMNVFKDGVFNIMQQYMQDSSLFNDGRKVWADIPRV